LLAEFFLADADGQEGQTYLGFDMFTKNDFTAGGKTATFATAAPLAIGDKIVSTATDSLITGEPANTSEFSPSITVVGHPWHNIVKPLDVDNDTHVAPIDALLVLTYLNKKLPSTVPADAENGKPNGFIDTDGDEHIAPIDALLVINALNNHLGGEGEDSQVGESNSAGSTPAIDQLLAANSDWLTSPFPRRKNLSN